MFGYSGLPPWMRTLGAIDEAGGGGPYPYMLAQSVGAPVPMAPGGGIGGGTPQVQAYNGHAAAAQMGDDNGVLPRSGMPPLPADDPRGLSAARGGAGTPAMPMGDMGPPKAGRYGMFAAPASVAGDPNRMPLNISPDLMQTGKVEKGHKGLFPGKDWKTWVGQILPAAIAGFTASRGNPAGQAMLAHMLKMKEQREAMNRPFQVGDSIVAPDGNGGYKPIYTTPQPFEQYAKARGFEPGTPEYAQAVEDYRLNSWSDPAMQARLGLTGYRYGLMGDLQEDRQKFSAGQQEDRQQHSDEQLTRRLSTTERGQNIRRDAPHRSGSAGSKGPQSEAALYASIMQKWTSGGEVNAREREFVRSYETRHKSGGGKSSRGSSSGRGSDLIGQVYQNGGRRIQYSKSRGGYVDLATGQPVQ